MKTPKQSRREAKQLFRLCVVDGMLDENACAAGGAKVLQSKPRGYLAILGAFQRLVKLDHARHTAKVESAMPLPPDLRCDVQARSSARTALA